MKKLLLVLLVLLSACTKVYVPTAPSTTTPTAPATKIDKIEFRVFGSQVSSPVAIRYIDPENGTAFVNGSLPYFAEVTNSSDSVFLFIEASSFGLAYNSSLQVQIFVNGQLFREGSSSGFTLLTQASGTFRR